MPTYTQALRPMELTTPLGKDALLLVGFYGHEGLSQLFRFQLDLVAENNVSVPFEKLLGQKMSVEWRLPDNQKRYFNGICARVSQGERDFDFTRYQVEVVPQFWLLTRRAQSRIFQALSVPDILKKVLEGLDIAWELVGTFEPRDYCVQYRETDFEFASRLMEEEGIYYFFKHAADGHKMVVANSPQSHPDLPTGSTLIFHEPLGGHQEEDRIYTWEKTQELRPGKYTLWDHCFELPHKHLEADKLIPDTVQSGRVTHRLRVANNDQLEIYDWPGEYAQRFDGVARGGGDRPADLQNIFQDNKRTVEIRMQEGTAPGLVIQGSGSTRHLVSGHKFDLTEHFDADGKYVLTSVQHSARQPLTPDDREEAFHYEATFTCIPAAVPFRPPRVTPRPTVRGTQTAVVVGPSDEEIFTDKYGRIKVQFHWDRQGQYNADSSCWLRVAMPWAGKNWGMLTIPRVGHEVVVDFLEGDPDQPIVIGSVYNADQMPAYKLPDEKTKSYLKSRSSKGGGGDNEIRFEDKKDNEQIYIHGQKDLDVRIEKDAREWIGQDTHQIVKRDKVEQIERDVHLSVQRDLVQTLDRDHNLTVKGKQAIDVTQSSSLKIGTNLIEEVGGNHSEKVTGSLYLQGMNVVIEAMTGLSIKVGGSFVTLNASGVQISGPMVLINSGGAALSGSPGSLVTPASSAAPAEADKSQAGGMVTYSGGGGAGGGAAGGGGAGGSQRTTSSPTHNPVAEENKDKKDWIEIVLKDEAGQPVAGEPYRVTLPDGSTLAEGTLDDQGRARVENIDPGSCKVTFPERDKDSWKPA